MKKMVYFHPCLNNPPLAGGCVHSHEILKTLKGMGFEIYLFLLETENRPVLTRTDWGYAQVKISMRHPDKKVIQERLSQYIESVQPEYIWMNYASWDFALDHSRFSSIKRIIYNHHFESIRKKMGAHYDRAWNAVSPKNFDEVTPELYDLNFYKDKELSVNPKEYQTYDQYDVTLVTEDFGADLIRKHCQRTKVASFPVTLSPRKSTPTYQRVALYTMSSYNFNYQGYYFFTKCVLPLILKEQPLFFVRLIGAGSEYFYPTQNIFCKQYVLNLTKEYERASLCLCPSFAGTGQQVKIIEAMHYGVPSVCMRVPTQFNPIQHGETGFIADSAEEFAKYTLLLYNDPSLAQKIGKKAREQAREIYHNGLLQSRLNILSQA